MQLIDIMDDLDGVIEDIEGCYQMGDLEDAAEGFIRKLRDISFELFDFYKDNKPLFKDIKNDIN